MIKNQTTMKEQLLIDHGYKYLWFIVLGAFLLVLILPFFKSVDLSVCALGLLLSALAEVLTTFFQHKHITFIISLVLGWLLALIICVILFFTLCGLQATCFLSNNEFK